MLVAALTTTSTTSTLAQGVATNFEAKPRAGEIERLSGWMASLPDSVLLSRLSLPGTHDSGARHDGFSMGFAKCQTWSISDQMRAGVRFLDIRCRHLNDRFLIYHGVIDQQLTFEQVRDACREFLKQQPTECIVMSVKEESTPSDNTRSFAETFADAIQNDGGLWYAQTAIPDLQSVRGKIVVIDRVGTLGGIPWSKLKRQDDFTAEPKSKANKIRAHLTQAVQSTDKSWFVNFCSGTVPSSLITPRKYALSSNQVPMNFIQQSRRPQPIRLGTILMDFPSVDLIAAIVGTNFAAAHTDD